MAAGREHSVLVGARGPSYHINVFLCGPDTSRAVQTGVAGLSDADHMLSDTESPVVSPNKARPDFAAVAAAASLSSTPPGPRPLPISVSGHSSSSRSLRNRFNAATAVSWGWGCAKWEMGLVLELFV